MTSKVFVMRNCDPAMMRRVWPLNNLGSGLKPSRPVSHSAGPFPAVDNTTWKAYLEAGKERCPRRPAAFQFDIAAAHLKQAARPAINQLVHPSFSQTEAVLQGTWQAYSRRCFGSFLKARTDLMSEPRHDVRFPRASRVAFAAIPDASSIFKSHAR